MSLALLLEPQLLAVGDAGGEVLGISATGPWVQTLAEKGVRHCDLASSTRGWNLFADLRSAGQLWGILRRERPTVLHTHNPKPGIYGRIVGRLAGVPIVVNTVHGLYATQTDRWQRRLLVYLLEGIASRFSDAELVQNEEDVATIKRFHLAAGAKVTLLGNGIDLTRFADSRDGVDRRVRETWGVDDDAVVIGTIGRLVAEKGYPELFEALRHLSAAATLVVIGPHDPDKSDALDEDIIRQARDSGVRFLGMRDDVSVQLAGFDIFVLASHREGFPRAAMEAAAVGLPIVATDIRGCRQVVDDGVNGVLVPAGDAAALCSTLDALIGDPDRRAAMGEASRRKALAEFDERAVVRTVMACYRQVAARKSITLITDPAAVTPTSTS